MDIYNQFVEKNWILKFFFGGGAFLMNFEAKNKTKSQISQEKCSYIIPNLISSQPGAS